MRPAIAPVRETAAARPMGPKLDRARTLIDPLGLYAAAIDTSDYVQRVAPLIRQNVAAVGDLLDVGAGGGQLGRAIRDSGHQWTAVEPSATMQARLARIADPPRIIAAGWEAADLPVQSHDTVLAASVGASLHQTNTFLAHCQALARRTVVWVVHAQRGPHGLVFAGCLPAAWHCEDETPGVEIVLRNLAPAARPHITTLIDWTFSAVVPDLAELANYLADRLGWPPSDRRRLQMAGHLAGQAKPDPSGYRLDIPRKSAVLIWGRPCSITSVASA
jgi:SAM-dependent methyltransferase